MAEIVREMFGLVPELWHGPVLLALAIGLILPVPLRLVVSWIGPRARTERKRSAIELEISRHRLAAMSQSGEAGQAEDQAIEAAGNETKTDSRAIELEAFVWGAMSAGIVVLGFWNILRTFNSRSSPDSITLIAAAAALLVFVALRNVALRVVKRDVERMNFSPCIVWGCELYFWAFISLFALLTLCFLTRVLLFSW